MLRLLVWLRGGNGVLGFLVEGDRYFDGGLTLEHKLLGLDVRRHHQQVLAMCLLRLAEVGVVSLENLIR